MLYRVSNIQWETDGEQVGLPQSIAVDVPLEELDDVEDFLSDHLSDEYESFHNGFQFAPVTEVNGIQIPREYVELAENWYDGQGDILYAVASSGNLTTGTMRPIDHDGQPMMDQKWYLSLWNEIDFALTRLLRSVATDHEDYDKLKAFQEYAQRVADQLREQYGLDD